MSMRAPLGVEPRLADVLPAGEDRVAPGHGDGVGRQGEGVLIDRAEIEDQADTGRVGGPACPAGSTQNSRYSSGVRSSPGRD